MMDKKFKTTAEDRIKVIRLWGHFRECFPFCASDDQAFEDWISQCIQELRENAERILERLKDSP